VIPSGHEEDNHILLSHSDLLLRRCAAEDGETGRAGGRKGLDGKGLYDQFCAVCHGKDGKGAGPAADALKQRPTDLTQIAHNNNGRFPDTKVMAILKGEQSVVAHGSQEMPTWGNIFNNISGNITVAQGRMHAVVAYLEEMQAK
jgi:mono/diheme cytochrome c family protein